MRCAHGLTPLIPSLPADSASRPVLQQLGASSAKAACLFEFLFLILTTLHGQATMTAEISTMRLDIGDIQEALKNHDSWMEDVSNTLQQMQEKEENLTEDIINLKNEMNTKLDTKVDNVAWKDRQSECFCLVALLRDVGSCSVGCRSVFCQEANDDLDAAIKTVRDMVSSLRLDVDARRRKVDEILATIRHDITAVETNLEEPRDFLDDMPRMYTLNRTSATFGAGVQGQDHQRHRPSSECPQWSHRSSLRGFRATKLTRYCKILAAHVQPRTSPIKTWQRHKRVSIRRKIR